MTRIDVAPVEPGRGETERLDGNVEVANVVINGEIFGEVRCRERVVLGEKARVTGDLHYGTIEMTLGARVDGKLYPLTGSTSETTSRSSGPATGATDFSLQPFDARSSGT